jgi:hypothetical protein
MIKAQEGGGSGYVCAHRWYLLDARKNPMRVFSSPSPNLMNSLFC